MKSIIALVLMLVAVFSIACGTQDSRSNAHRLIEYVASDGNGWTCEDFAPSFKDMAALYALSGDDSETAYIKGMAMTADLVLSSAALATTTNPDGKDYTLGSRREAFEVIEILCSDDPNWNLGEDNIAYTELRDKAIHIVLD